MFGSVSIAKIRAQIMTQNSRPEPRILSDPGPGFWHDNCAPVLSSKTVITDQIVALLIAERDRLNRAIEVLQGPQSAADAQACPLPRRKA